MSEEIVIAPSPTSKKTRRKRLTRAEKEPGLALRHGWFRDREFCAALLDRCEHQALVATPGFLERTLETAEIVESHGDRHLVNRYHGVLSFAYVVCGEIFWAGKTLRDHRRAALECCPRCRGDHFRRYGDLLVEQRQGRKALEAFERSVTEAGGALAGDALGRLCFVRGIAHHFAGRRDLALADGGRSLLELDLDSPRGLFLDNISFLAIYTMGGDPRHEASALAHLDAFEARLKGLSKGWGYVRGRLKWAQGQLHALLGDPRRALRNLEAGHGRLLEHGLPREVTACALDVGQYRCRRFLDPYEPNVVRVRRTLDRSLTERSDLAVEHREGLGEMKKVLATSPEDAFRELKAFRRSFLAPVPPLLGERVRG